MEEILKATLEFRKMIDSSVRATQDLVKQSDLTDEELLKYIDLYPKWRVGVAVKVDDYYKHEGKLYKVITEHTTQEDWEPQQTPALFNSVQPQGVIPEFVQPTGGHNAYNTGALITFEGKTYKSLVDNNSYSPTDYPVNWEEVE